MSEKLKRDISNVNRPAFEHRNEFAFANEDEHKDHAIGEVGL